MKPARELRIRCGKLHRGQTCAWGNASCPDCRKLENAMNAVLRDKRTVAELVEG